MFMFLKHLQNSCFFDPGLHRAPHRPALPCQVRSVAPERTVLCDGFHVDQHWGGGGGKTQEMTLYNDD